MAGWLKWVWDSITGRFNPEAPSEIEPGLWMGPRPSSPLPASITCVLNVSEHQDPADLRMRLARYDWEPIKDGPQWPGDRWLTQRVQWIETCRHAGCAVLVHCTDGQSRSGLVVLACLMSWHGWTAQHALAMAQQVRPVCQPNPAFLRGLENYESTLTAASRWNGS